MAFQKFSTFKVIFVHFYPGSIHFRFSCMFRNLVQLKCEIFTGLNRFACQITLLQSIDQPPPYSLPLLKRCIFRALCYRRHFSWWNEIHLKINISEFILKLCQKVIFARSLSNYIQVIRFKQHKNFEILLHTKNIFHRLFFFF